MAVAFVNLWLYTKVHLKRCTRLVTPEMAAIYLLWPQEFTPHFTTTATSWLHKTPKGPLLFVRVCSQVVDENSNVHLSAQPIHRVMNWSKPTYGCNTSVITNGKSSKVTVQQQGSRQKGGLPLFRQPASETPWPECSLVLGLNVPVLHCLY